jgi:ElaB/YqjD/DUF883 family membrane-anchored ribosome-binding protein
VSDSSLAQRSPTRLARADETPSLVKAELHAARERMKAKLDALEKDLGALAQWRETVRKHPVLTIGGALVAGYLLGRMWGRR